MRRRYVIEAEPSIWVNGWVIRDRVSGRRVAIIFTRRLARDYRDWLNARENST